MFKNVLFISGVMLGLLMPTGVAGGAFAQQAPVERAEAWVQSDGFEQADDEALMEAVNAALSTEASQETVRLPAADLGALTLSVLALDLREPAVERARYRISRKRVSMQVSAGGAKGPYSLVEVTRFNLAPAVRKSLIETYGEDKVAPASAFSSSPHIAWRLVTRPLMGNRAVIVAAGRRIVTGDDAGKAECMGEPCLSVAPLIDAAAPWGRMDSAALEDGPLQPRLEDGTITPASISDILFADLAPYDADDALATDMSEATMDILAVIESGLGQDAGVDAAFRRPQRDDSVRAMWRRVASLSGGAGLFKARAYECARGPDFAEPDAYCP